MNENEKEMRAFGIDNDEELSKIMQEAISAEDYLISAEEYLKSSADLGTITTSSTTIDSTKLRNYWGRAFEEITKNNINPEDVYKAEIKYGGQPLVGMTTPSKKKGGPVPQEKDYDEPIKIAEPVILYVGMSDPDEDTLKYLNKTLKVNKSPKKTTEFLVVKDLFNYHNLIGDVFRNNLVQCVVVEDPIIPKNLNRDELDPSEWYSHSKKRAYNSDDMVFTSHLFNPGNTKIYKLVRTPELMLVTIK